MGRGFRCVCVLASFFAGCGPGVRVDPVPASGGAPGDAGPFLLGPAMGGAILAREAFQPGFHQAMRATHWRTSPTTFRFRIPVARAGDRLRIAFRAGDGRMRLARATVARVGEGGVLASDPVPLTFGGAAGAGLEAWQRAVSDPLDFAVGAGEDLAVSFEAEGALAASAIDAFPGSYLAPGAQAAARELADAAEWRKLAGVQTVDVRAKVSRAFVAIGDSITEGFVDGDDDHRLAWPALAGALAETPVVNAAVSGQGLWAVNEYREEDVGALEGITDCAVLIGTNDLAADPSAELIDRLSALFSWLEDRGCRVWAGTLLPKEKTSAGDLSLVNARRARVNAWLRAAPVHAVIDFEAAVAAPGDPDRFAPGMDEDGIHPSYAGQRAMAELAAGLIAPR